MNIQSGSNDSVSDPRIWSTKVVGILVCVFAMCRLGLAFELRPLPPTENSAPGSRYELPREVLYPSYSTDSANTGSAAPPTGVRPGTIDGQLRTPTVVATSAHRIVQPGAHVSHIHIASAYLDRIEGAEVNIVESNLQPVQRLGMTDASGRVPIRLRMDEDGNLEGAPAGGGKQIIIEITRDGYISRHATLSWSNAAQFEEGFAVSLWRESDLNNLDYIIVNNPHEYAVVLACDSGPNSTPMVMAKGIDEDAIQLRHFARDARSVTRPKLARALYAEAPVGLQVPEEFVAEIERLCQELPTSAEDIAADLSSPDILEGAPFAAEFGAAANVSYAYGQFLFLRPRCAKVAYALRVGAFNNFEGVAFVDPDAEPGVKVGFNFALDATNDLDISYTRFESQTADASLQNSIPLVTVSRIDAASATATLDIDFDLIDVAIRRTIVCCKEFDVNCLVGARYVDLEQQFASTFVDTNVFMDRHVADTDIDFQGGGIRLGLEAENHFYHNCFHVFANGFANLMVGRTRADYNQAVFTGPLFPFPPVGIASANLDEIRFVPTLDLEVGVGWTSCSGRLRLNAGYQVSAWFNTLTTQEWIGGVQAGNLAGLRHTLTFDGLRAGLEYRF